MERFINAENVRHYRRILSEPRVAEDQVRHALLVRLLAEEVAKAENWDNLRSNRS
jgi:hypothetical protein